MIIEERFVVKAAISKVWDFLVDATGLASCVPGCEQVEAIGDNSYKAHIKARIGPISANFTIRVDITETNPPVYLKSTMKGEDTKMASNLTASSVIELKPIQSEETEISYRSEVTVLGRLGRFGEGIMPRKAREVGERFARSIKERLDAPVATS